jgi:GNAT superfamily N-acetyltransferase
MNRPTSPETVAARPAFFRIQVPEGEKVWKEVRQLRWTVLRAPLGQPPGSETDGRDVPGRQDVLHRVACLEDGQVVGTGRGDLREPGVMQIRYMAVAEGFRGRGIGAAILLDLESASRVWEVTRWTLEARPEAVAFYERHGYRAVGPGKRLFNVIPHVWMTKDAVPER